MGIFVNSMENFSEKLHTGNKIKQVGLSRATLEFQVCKILSIVKISKLDPSVSKICCQKNWLNFDKVCINLTSPDLTCPDLTNPHLTWYGLICPDLSCADLICPACLSRFNLFWIIWTDLTCPILTASELIWFDLIYTNYLDLTFLMCKNLSALTWLVPTANFRSPHAETKYFWQPYNFHCQAARWSFFPHASGHLYPHESFISCF